jgi:hypothetical protein
MYRQDGGERLLLRVFASITKKEIMATLSEVAPKVPAKGKGPLFLPFLSKLQNHTNHLP